MRIPCVVITASFLFESSVHRNVDRFNVNYVRTLSTPMEESDGMNCVTLLLDQWSRPNGERRSDCGRHALPRMPFELTIV